MFLDKISFSFPEILSLVGLIQCVYLLVYIGFRIGQISKVGLPLLYFFVLACAFFFDLAENHIGALSHYYDYLQWVAWFSGPPLSVLLVIQFANLKKPINFFDFWIVLLIPLGFVLSALAVGDSPACQIFQPCDELKGLMRVTGLLAGAMSLLIIFSKKNLFIAIRNQKLGKERYWLILSMICMNICFLSIMLGELVGVVETKSVPLLRTIVGLGFVYLVSTSLLRLYPQPRAKSHAVSTNREEELSPEDRIVVQRIERLMTHEKVYQEPGYARADLSQECGVSETVISRIINIYFQKSYPQLVNEYRVKDAKQLLIETDAPVKLIGEEVGFNALPSFNRVFKEITGQSPSAYRATHKI